jgi:DNA-binding XRE family transcriptional regulator
MMVSSDPLPRAAKLALRKYRLQETRRVEVECRHNLRVAAREMIAQGHLNPREKEALVLALGLEDNDWRTHKQVAELMHLSVERVRQLLLPSRVALSEALKERFTWPITGKARSRSIIKKPELPVFKFENLPILQCATCKVEKPLPQNPIPAAAKVRALILKPNPLSGSDVRALRQAMGVGPGDLARHLDVTRQALQNWETLPALRFVNDIALRVIFANLILSSDEMSDTHSSSTRRLAELV